MKPLLRNGTYHLVRKVPRRFASVESRKQIWISLKTDSLTQATAKAPAAWAAMVEGWEARLNGDSKDAQVAYDRARRLAQTQGFRYLPIDKVAELPIADVLQRVEAVKTAKGVDTDLASAVLGTVPKPVINVSEALNLYWDIAVDRLTGKSEGQIRRWRNPRLKAVRNFIDVVGNIPIEKIGPDELLDFRDWWVQRVQSGEVTANSANKDFTHLSDVLRTVNKMKRLGLVLPLSDLRLREGEKNTRPPFSRDWIRDKILQPGALGGLNSDARALVLGMINTGYRPSEAACLTRAQIRLDANVPHISIEPVGRTLKTQHARRLIPLTGVSLEAFREFPDGFTRYQGKDNFSNTINKYFAENGLRETPDHTLYSLRHTFQDSMINAGIDDRIRRNVFGHRLSEDKYGAGADLAVVHDLLAQIAF